MPCRCGHQAHEIAAHQGFGVGDLGLVQHLQRGRYAELGRVRRGEGLGDVLVFGAQQAAGGVDEPTAGLDGAAAALPRIAACF